MKLSEYDYELDSSLIAQNQQREQTKSRLMVLDKTNQTWKHHPPI